MIGVDLLMHLPGQVRAVDELPRNHVPPTLGGRDRVLAAVRRDLPEADLTDGMLGPVHALAGALGCSSARRPPGA